MKVLVTWLAVLALAAGTGGCGGSDSRPTLEEQAAPAAKPKSRVDVIQVGAGGRQKSGDLRRVDR